MHNALKYYSAKIAGCKLTARIYSGFNLRYQLVTLISVAYSKLKPYNL